ncbi:MAG: MFS transporter [Acidimicrobiales bacterium]
MHKKWGTLLAVSLATVMLLVNFMAVSVSLPAVRHGLGASLPQLQWVLEAFVVTTAVFVLPAGHVADRNGHRAVFLVGAGAFSFASLLAALAPSALGLIGTRALQGMGGAMLLATGPVLLADMSRTSSGRAPLAVWGMLTALAVASAPAIGGAITSWLGWRWVFLVNAPVGALALVIGIIAIGKPVGRPTAQRGRGRPYDWSGLLLFTSSIALLVVGLTRTTETSWPQSGALSCLASSGLLLVAFVALEATKPNPMLDISLFRQRTFTGSSLSAFGLSVAVLGPLMFLVLYLSDELGYSVGALSVRILVMTVMTLPLMPVANWLGHHLSLTAVVCTGALLVSAGLWLMSRLSANTTCLGLVPGFVLAGSGLELANPRLAIAASATVEPQLAAVAYRTGSALRQAGAAVGVAALGSVFATRVSDDITARLANVPHLADRAPQIARSVALGRSAQALREVPPGLRSLVPPVIRLSLTDATHEVLVVAAAVALAAAIAALLVKPAPTETAWAASTDVPAAPATSAESPKDDRPRQQPTLAEGGPPSAQQALSGKVVALSGAPVAGATITLTDRSGAVVAQAITGTDGTFPLPGAAEGSYTLEATAPHYQKETVTLTLPAAGMKTCLRLVGLGWLAGQVKAARDGRAVAAEIELMDGAGPVAVQQRTDDDGRFRVGELPEGAYTFLARAPGYQDFTVPVVVHPGVTTSVKARMVGLGHVFGAVTGPGGGWLAGIDVALRDSAGRTVATTRTDSAGSYQFAAVPEGTYQLVATAWTNATFKVSIEGGKAVAADIRLGTIS